MKLKYPAEAFALGIIIFSAGMKASFAAGILVILAVVFAEFLKNLLEPFVPVWSLRSCVLVATAAVFAGACNLGFSALSIPMETETWVFALAIGLFAAKHALTADLEAEYGEIFWESGIVWGFWVLLGAVREFFGSGSIFGYELTKTAVQSRTFLNVFFGFLAAGLILAAANAILKKKSTDTYGLLTVLPVAVLARAFEAEMFGDIIGILWAVIVPLVMFISVKKTLKFARTGQAFRGLPVEMLSMGFIYMILSVF